MTTTRRDDLRGELTWQEYLTLSPTERARKDVIARLDPVSQAAANRLYHPTAKDREESKRRQQAINAVSQREINLHCQVPPPPKKGR